MTTPEEKTCKQHGRMVPYSVLFGTLFLLVNLLGWYSTGFASMDKIVAVEQQQAHLRAEQMTQRGEIGDMRKEMNKNFQEILQRLPTRSQDR